MANVVFPESEGTFLAWPHPVGFSCGQAASVPKLDLRDFKGIQLPAWQASDEGMLTCV
jgi:hypothetical protein